MLKIKSQLGPAEYVQGAAAGGVRVAFGEFEKVVSAIAKCDNDDILAADDTVYALRISITGTTVVILVFSASTTGAGPNAWTEIDADSVLSGRTFTVIADGY